MEDLFSLAGKTALVTGGAQGLGHMIAEALIGAGATVYITSRKADACREAAVAMGPRCHALPGDVGSPEGIAEIGGLYRQAGGGPLDILVNNAGRTWGAPLESFPDKAWAGVMAVNVQSPFRTVQEFLGELTEAGTPEDPARVVHIGSVAGAITSGISAYSYSASKAAIAHLGKQMARDLMGRHINVNTILPGFFPTSMTEHLRNDPDRHLARQIPMGRLGRPGDIGGAVIFLASAASAYVTGIDLPVDGGLSGCRP